MKTQNTFANAIIKIASSDTMLKEKEKCFELVCEELGDWIFSEILRQLGEKDLPETRDITQIVLIKLYRYLPQIWALKEYSAKSTIEPKDKKIRKIIVNWLKTVISREVMNLKDYKRKHSFAELTTREEMQLTSESDDVAEQGIDLALLRQHIDRALLSMETGHREIVLMKLQEKSNSEIATVLNLKTTENRKRIDNAINYFRKKLKEEFKKSLQQPSVNPIEREMLELFQSRLNRF